MRKIFVSFMLVICLASPSFAVFPLAIPAAYWVGSAVINAAAAAGLFYYNRTGSSTVNSDASITNPAKVQWINTADLSLPEPAVQSKNLNASVTEPNLRNIVSSSPVSGMTSVKYPKLDAALNNITGRDWNLATDTDFRTAVAGDNLIVNGTKYGIDSVSTTTGGCNGSGVANPTWVSLPWVTTYFAAGSGPTCSAPGTIVPATSMHLIQPPYPPKKVAKTPAELKTALAETGGIGTIKATYDAEIDALMQDPSYIPTFSDATTGLPYTSPASSTVATPSQVAAANNIASSAVAQTTAATSAQTAAAAAQTAATAAQTAANSAGSASAANPSDTALAQKALDAAAAASKAASDAAAAVAALDKLIAEQAAASAKTSEEELTAPVIGAENIYDADITPPTKKSITDLLTGFVSGSPIVSMVNSFKITTSNSTGVVPIGTVYGKELSFDFTRYQATLSALGGILLIIMHGFAVLIVVRGW